MTVIFIFLVTGEILKCIVIVDTLHRIEIETTTRLLYLEDSPEELMVRGYDQEGMPFEPQSKKNGLQGFRPGLTQTCLCSYR